MEHRRAPSGGPPWVKSVHTGWQPALAEGCKVVCMVLVMVMVMVEHVGA